MKSYSKNDLYDISELEIKRIWDYFYNNIESILKYKDLYNNMMSVFGKCPDYIQECAIENNFFSVPDIYYKASEDIGKKLSEIILCKNDYDIYDVLECLAMQGGKYAVSTFIELNKNNELKKNLSEYHFENIIHMYANIGGWDFDDFGNKIVLIYDNCVSIRKSEYKNNVLNFFNVIDNICPRCGNNMVNIVSVDCNNDMLKFLNLEGIITVSCCIDCVCYYEYYSKYNVDGTNKPIFDKELIDNAVTNSNDEGMINFLQDIRGYSDNNFFTLDSISSSVFYSSYDWEENSIGGFAHWVDDANYTKCPECGKTMKYLMQVNNDLILSGSLYICICSDCCITSVSYQQT